MKKIIEWFKKNFKKEKVHGMTVIRNPFIPFPGYKAINLFGILFTKPKAVLNELTINHESIHSRQYKEVTLLLAIIWIFVFRWFSILIIPFGFYIWYVVEFIIRWAVIRNWDDAYRNIGFEKEAYVWQGIPEGRKMFGWIRYVC